MFGLLNNLHSQINNGEFTILNLHREVGGHTVVMGKMDDNLYIIDPQQETVYKEEEKMDIDNNNNNCIDMRSISSLFENYLISEQVIGLSFIVIREKTGKRSASLPISIRKSKTPEPPLKKRKLKLSGGKKKNGKKKKTYKKNGKKKLKHTRKYKKKKTIKKHKKKSGKKKH